MDLRRAKGKVYWIEYYDLQHKRRRERIGPNRQIAEARLAEVKRQLAAGKFVPESQLGNILFSDFWEKHYMPWVTANNSKRWIERKDEIYRLYFKPAFADRRLKDITRQHIETYMRERLQAGAAPATVNRDIAVLKHALGKAVEWGLLGTNPAKGIKLFKEKDDAWNVIPEDEWERIYNSLPNEKKPLFAFLWYTGVRLSNAIYLKWEHVNLKEGYIRIPASYTKQKKELILPIPDYLVSIFGHQKRRFPDSAYVFPSRSGTPFNRSNIRRAWVSALKKAGINKHYRIHDIRHSFGARAVRAGVDVRVIKELLGHQTFEMVLRYTHVDFQSLKEALNRMNRKSKMDTYMDT